MFNPRLQILRGVAIVLALLSHGYVQADDYSDNRSTAQFGSDTTNDADILAASRTILEPVANVSSDNSDVIEEIVVIGAKKSRRPNLDHGLGADPVITKPSRLDWQFFPVFDTERAPRHIGLYQIDDQIRRVGLIEIFRISFRR